MSTTKKDRKRKEAAFLFHWFFLRVAEGKEENQSNRQTRDGCKI